MKKIFIITTFFLATFNLISCDYFKDIESSNYNALMGKKSMFYDAYKQGKCVLENALQPLSKEQKKIIAKLIAKSYIEDTVFNPEIYNN